MAAADKCQHCELEQCICCCDSECPYFGQEDAPDGPCEGPVEVVDEEVWGEPGNIDSCWVHRCAKHAENYYKRGY